MAHREHPSGNWPGQRGFVIIVVLAAMAVISAVVASQLVSGQKAAVTGLRVSEEVRARSIAQACMEMLTAYAERTEADAGPGSDFDRLLAGPDGVNGPLPGDPDDFLPFGTTRKVSIPPSSSSQLHAWNLVDIPNSGGICAVRFEDNSDDGRPPMPMPDATVADSPGEGGGADVPNMDRDLSVYLTVIGMYPFLPGTTDADAYAKAHTRVTLRRLIQNVNVFQPLAPALWAGGGIDLQNNNDICGAGGIMANTIQMANNSCACGELVASTTSGPGIPTEGDTCACPSFCPPANLPGTTPTTPPVNVHWVDLSLSSNQGLGAPLRANPVEDPLPEGDGIGIGEDSPVADPVTTYDLSDTSVCAFFADLNDPSGDERIYVWDAQDADAINTLTLTFGSTVEDTLGTPIPGPVNCTNQVGAAVPPPCNWNFSTNEIVCAATQSPCWKLVARLDDLDTPDLDVQIGAGTTAGWTDGASDQGFHPRQNVAIPNVAGLRSFGPGTLLNPRLCGASTGSCTSCSSLSALDNTTAFVELHGGSGEHFHWEEGANSAFGPSPSFWFVRQSTSAPSDRDVHIKEAGSVATGALKASFVTDGSIVVETDGSDPNAICCATCACGALGSLTTLTDCDRTTSFGATPNPVVTTLFNTNRGLFDYSSASPLPENTGQPGGYALKAAGSITIDTNLVVGDIRGSLVAVSDGCFVGSIAGYNAGSDGIEACSASGTCGEPSVCVETDARVIGDIHSMGDIEFLGNNARIYGNIAAKGSACFKNNAQLEGTVMVGNTIEMKNNATIVNTAAAALGDPQAANAKVVTFMEATW